MWENVIFQQENVLIKIYGGRMHIHHVILKDSCREVSINLISEIKLVLRATCRQPPDHMNSSRELVIRPHSSIHYHKGSVDKKKKWTADIWQSFHGQKQKGADNHIGWAQSTPDSRPLASACCPRVCPWHRVPEGECVWSAVRPYPPLSGPVSFKLQ